MSRIIGFTKEGIEVKGGQRWRDLDYRMSGRIVEVVHVIGDTAVVHRVGDNSKRNTVLSINRMHKHSTGWALVPQTITERSASVKSDRSELSEATMHTRNDAVSQSKEGL
jgi:hypothetical protein